MRSRKPVIKTKEEPPRLRAYKDWNGDLLFDGNPEQIENAINFAGMSQKDRFIALLKEFGVGYKIEKSKSAPIFTVRLIEGNRKVGGYCGFYADFDFNYRGEFDFVAIGE